MIWITAISALVVTIWTVLSGKRPRLALLTLPAAAGIILMTGLMMSIEARDEGFLFSVAVTWTILTVLVNLLILAGTPYDHAAGRYPWPRTWARGILISAGYLLLLVILLGLFNLFGLIFFALFLAGAFRFQKTGRYANVMEILSAISHCVRRGLPLPMALHTAAQNHPHAKTAKVMQSISHWLVQGLPLSEAVRNGWPRVPLEVVTTIEAAEKVSQLPQALESLEKDLAERVDDYKQVRPVHPFYPLIVIAAAFLVIMGLFIFILPTFAEVLSDISEGQERLPQPTQFLLDTAHFLTSNKGLPVLLILLGVIGLIELVIFLRLRRRRPGTVLTSVCDRIKWHLPLQGWFERHYSQLRLVEYLRAAFRAGRPVNEALRESLVLDMNECYKQRIVRWAERIENGVPFAEAARQAGMGPTMTWAFDEGLNRRNLPEILTMIEETTRGSYDYRANILRSILWPVVILLLGMVIGFFVYAFFLPMVQLIYITMEYSMP